MVKCECGHKLRQHNFSEDVSPCLVVGCGCAEFIVKPERQAKPEKKYLILELLEEDAYSEAEWQAEVEQQIGQGLEDVNLVKIKNPEIEWLPGTRFFRAPASFFFSDEALRDEKE